MGGRSSLLTAAARFERQRCIDIIQQRGREIGGAIQPDRTIAAILADAKERGVA